MLSGIWSGELPVSAPGFAWGPFDRLTISFTADRTLGGLEFASHLPPPHTFGSGAVDFPLQGTRDVPLVHGSIYTVRVTVETADFVRDHFHLRYRVVGVGATPNTDYVEDVTGQLNGAALDVTYSLVGTLLIAPIAANASGHLRAE